MDNSGPNNQNNNQNQSNNLQYFKDSNCSVLVAQGTCSTNNCNTAPTLSAADFAKSYLVKCEDSKCPWFPMFCTLSDKRLCPQVPQVCVGAADCEFWPWVCLRNKNALGCTAINGNIPMLTASG